MIRLSEIAEAGHFNKAHGIKGEMSATLDFDLDLDEIKCLIVSIEGIFVPFFIRSWRPRTADTCLLTLEGIDSDAQAQEFNNRTFYILRVDIPEEDESDEDNEEGFYASDLIGYKVHDVSLGDIGLISGINDATENVLFLITTPDGNEIFVPVADEYIDDVDHDNETITTDLPEGLVDLNG
ncbi:MAG: 16S rRNA processing protein RimM [Bacteroides sp.]|nr:16S rRNA processing protein RimM [Bacteroides sp.]